MSGGRFNYQDSSLKDEIFGYADKVTNVFEDREISELVWDVLDLIHDYDWYASGDTCEETWLKQKAKFKKKWFETPRMDRLKKIIDETAEGFKLELYKTTGIKITPKEVETVNKAAQERIRKIIESKMDMQELYLPQHFLDVLAGEWGGDGV